MSLNGRRGGPGRAGFALLVVLGLLSFTLLLLVALANLGRIETRRGEELEFRALARQQARYALGLALAQLEAAAGPDRRATATAEILGVAAEGAAHWTGVWDPRAGPEAVTWLVTAPEDAAGAVDPRRPQGSGAILHGRVEEDDVVAVPWREVRGRGTGPSPAALLGRVAWWTADEGVKASVRALDRVDSVSEDPVAASALRQRGHPGQSWRSWFAKDAPAQAVDEETWMELLEGNQVWQALGGGSEAVAGEARRRHFHDLTLESTGLLTNSLDGGLRENLGHPDDVQVSRRFDDVFGNGAVLRAWAALPRPDGDGVAPMRPLAREAYEALPEGWPYVHVAPLLSEAALYVSVFHYDFRGYAGPAFRYYFKAELWNPYACDLLLVDGGDRRRFTLEVTGLPDLRVENLSTGAQTGPISMDRSPRPDGRPVTASWLELGEATGRPSGDGRFVLRAGEIYALDEPDPMRQPRGLIKYAQVPLAVNEDHRVLLSASPGDPRGLVFRLTEGATPGGPELLRVTGLRYEPFQYLFSPPLSRQAPPYRIRSTDVDVADMFVMGFHFRLGESVDWRRPGDWIWQQELRRPLLAHGTGDGLLATASHHPVLFARLLSGRFDGQALLVDRRPRHQGWGEDGDVRLYDLPAGDPLTVADFRLLPFKGLPPRAVGSPAGKRSLNMAFDRYFLSPVPPTGESPAVGARGQERFPQTRLRLRRGMDAGSSPGVLRGPGAAEHFVVRGAFNWNSTRVRAWEAVLRQGFSGERPWRYRDQKLQGRQRRLAAAFFRHPWHGHYRQAPLDDDALARAGAPARRQSAFRQGGRFFGELDGDADDPVRRLAEAIVRELRQRGAPFFSLGEFLDSGLFDRAIAAAGLNEGRPRGSNIHLEQSDLAALLALAPAVRSDTFLIRAVGEAVHPGTGETRARAWLEARVQRAVDFADPGIAATAVSGAPRRFQVLSRRWYRPTEAQR